MDPTLATLTLGSRVWVICERHRLAQQGTVITVSPESLTVKLPWSSLPSQRYDRMTGMWIPSEGPQRSNCFFIRSSLPGRFTNRHARPEYVVVGEETVHAPT